MRAWILGTAGWMPTGRRETTCVLIRDGSRALLLDVGSGARRLVTDPALLDGVTALDIVLSHFHLDHVCGLGYLPATGLVPSIWAPGRALYDTPSAQLLEPLRTPPLSPFAASELGSVYELGLEAQQIGSFALTTRAQPRHWAPTMGLRVGDALALVTDTAYDPGSAAFAGGVGHLLHEAWSTSTEPHGTEGDATAREAGRVARDARAGALTLVHLSPKLDGHESALLGDARAEYGAAQIGEDAVELTL